MDTDKENIPTTPKQHVEPSPTTKNALKPISPNKQSSVGRLNFLQNDNIDEHFNQIHSIQNVIQQQLYNLEVQTKQTGLDVGQISDRSKNNNQHLNKLLQNIANYSEEVITEGNATKKDITNIVKRLNEFSRELEKSSGIADTVSKKNIGIAEEIKTTLNEVKESLNKNETNDLNQIWEKFDGSRTESLKALKTDFEAELKKSLQESGSEENSAVVQDLADIKKVLSRNLNNGEQQTQIISKLDELKQALPERDLVRQIVDPVVAELKSVSLDARSQKLLEDILGILGREKRGDDNNKSFQLETKTNLDEIKHNGDNLNAIITEQNKQIQQLSSKLHLSQSIDELESKYENLQVKYDEMSREYERKHKEFRVLQEHFKELAISSTKLSVTPSGNPSAHRLSKVRQLHVSKMDEISRDNSWTLPVNKRIVSTPVVKKNYVSVEGFETISEGTKSEGNNSDDESFDSTEQSEPVTV